MHVGPVSECRRGFINKRENALFSAEESERRHGPCGLFWAGTLPRTENIPDGGLYLTTQARRPRERLE